MYPPKTLYLSECKDVYMMHCTATMERPSGKVVQQECLMCKHWYDTHRGEDTPIDIHFKGRLHEDMEKWAVILDAVIGTYTSYWSCQDCFIPSLYWKSCVRARPS